jgi:hypothetical protein
MMMPPQQLVINPQLSNKKLHLRLLDAAAIPPPSANAPETCKYCDHKYGPYCRQPNKTPWTTPDCETLLVDMGFRRDSVPQDLRKYLRKDRKDDSSTDMRNVAVGVRCFPCCPSCCLCTACTARLAPLPKSPTRKGRIAQQMLDEQQGMDVMNEGGDCDNIFDQGGDGIDGWGGPWGAEWSVYQTSGAIKSNERVFSLQPGVRYAFPRVAVITDGGEAVEIFESWPKDPM